MPISAPGEKCDMPKTPCHEAPNISAKPNAQNASDEIRKSTRFLMVTLMPFLARAMPVSSRRKPACISMTRNAENKTHTTWAGAASENIRELREPCRGPRETSHGGARAVGYAWLRAGLSEAA